MARTLRAELSHRRQLQLTHGECLDIVARQLGAESWNHLSVELTRSAESATRGLPWQAVNATVPVLRIFAVEQALQFYVEFLGFSLDFGGPAGGPGTPFYGQVSRAATSLQLTEHHYDPRPGATVLLWMSGIDRLRAELDERRHDVPVWGPAVWTPEIEDAPWAARVLTIGDPFGNHLRFTEPNDPAARGVVPRWS
jgi:catechol 2,3-dioxygenase-like lactoylglutathione lyase family enzyme